MKIHFECHGIVFEFERHPMPPERFTVLCKLTGAIVGGIVLLDAIRMVGVWAIAWTVGALVAVGFYKMIRGSMA